MTRILYLTIAILLGSASIIFAQPKLEIEGGGTYDWGDVKQEDSPLKAKIKLWNKGNQTLEIKQVKPGCGCTTDSLDMNSVPPGKYATLGVTLKITGYQGKTTKGIRIYSNDPDNGEKHLTISCNVIVPVSAFPRYLGFNRLIVGEEGITKSIISNNTPKPLKIVDYKLKIASSDIDESELKVNLKKNIKIDTKGQFAVELKYKPKKPGRLQATLEIMTDSKDDPKIELPIWGNVVEQQTGSSK